MGSSSLRLLNQSSQFSTANSTASVHRHGPVTFKRAFQERNDSARCSCAVIGLAILSAFSLPNLWSDDFVLETRSAGRADAPITQRLAGELLINGIETGHQWTASGGRIHRVDEFVLVVLSDEGQLFLWNSRPGARRFQFVGRGYALHVIQGDGSALIVRRATYAGDEEAGAHGLTLFDIDLSSTQPKLRELWRDDRREPPSVSFTSRHRDGLIVLLEDEKREFTRLDIKPGGSKLLPLNLFGARPHAVDGDRLLTTRPMEPLQCTHPYLPEDFDIEVGVVDLQSGAHRVIGTARATWRSSHRGNPAPEPVFLLAWADDDVRSKPASFWTPRFSYDACTPLDASWFARRTVANFVIRSTEQLFVIEASRFQG